MRDVKARAATNAAVRDTLAAAAANPVPEKPRCIDCGEIANFTNAGRCFNCHAAKFAPKPDPTAPTETPTVETWPGYVPIWEKYRGQNPARILAALPGATDVRGFHDWIKAGRVVRKGQHGILIYTPAGGMGEDADGVIDERRPRVKRAFVFDISQTDVLTPKADKAAAVIAATEAHPVTANQPIAGGWVPSANVTPFPPATHTPPPPAPALRADDI